jgi:hypothetical protein
MKLYEISFIRRLIIIGGLGDIYLYSYDLAVTIEQVFMQQANNSKKGEKNENEGNFCGPFIYFTATPE